MWKPEELGMQFPHNLGLLVAPGGSHSTYRTTCAYHSNGFCIMCGFPNKHFLPPPSSLGSVPPSISHPHENPRKRARRRTAQTTDGRTKQTNTPTQHGTTHTPNQNKTTNKQPTNQPTKQTPKKYDEQTQKRRHGSKQPNKRTSQQPSKCTNKTGKKNNQTNPRTRAGPHLGARPRKAQKTKPLKPWQVCGLPKYANA